MKRSYLVAAAAVLGVGIVLYALGRALFGWTFGEKVDNDLLNGAFVVGIGLLIYNRKLAADEAAIARRDDGADAAASPAAVPTADSAANPALPTPAAGQAAAPAPGNGADEKKSAAASAAPSDGK
jgi:hypothetical protein